MQEKSIEMKLVSEVKKRGGLCPKLTCPGTDGMPDRMVLLPMGCIVFVEVKAPGKKPRPLQRRCHEQLRSLGFKVFVLDNPELVGRILDEIHAA